MEHENKGKTLLPNSNIQDFSVLPEKSKTEVVVYAYSYIGELGFA